MAKDVGEIKPANRGRLEFRWTEDDGTPRAMTRAATRRGRGELEAKRRELLGVAAPIVEGEELQPTAIPPLPTDIPPGTPEWWARVARDTAAASHAALVARDGAALKLIRAHASNVRELGQVAAEHQGYAEAAAELERSADYLERVASQRMGDDILERAEEQRRLAGTLKGTRGARYHEGGEASGDEKPPN